MVSYQLYKLIEKTLNNINEHSEFIEFLNKLSNFSNSTMLSLFKATNHQGSAIIEPSSAVQKEINQIKNFIKTEYSPNKTFHSSRELISVLHEFYSKLDTEKENLESFIVLIPLLSNFTSNYEEFLLSTSFANTLMLLYTSRRLLDSIDILRANLSIIKNQLQLEPLEIEEGFGLLSIEFPSEISVSQFSSKLSAISEIYEELKLVFKDKEEVAPIEILKIESGSFFATVLGDKELILVFTALIYKGIKYLHYKYSAEGQRTQLHEKIELTHKVIELNQTLIDYEIKTEGKDEEINKAGVEVSKSLNKLLKGEPEVTVNDEHYSVDAITKQKLLENKQKSIPHDLDSEN